jgi:hypothetical protein
MSTTKITKKITSGEKTKYAGIDVVKSDKKSI